MISERCAKLEQNKFIINCLLLHLLLFLSTLNFLLRAVTLSIFPSARNHRKFSG